MLGSYGLTVLSMIAMLIVYLKASVTKRNTSKLKLHADGTSATTTTPIAIMLNLSFSAIFSVSAAEMTRRELRNHQYATGPSRLTKEGSNGPKKLTRFLLMSIFINVSASIVTVILGIVLAACWGKGTPLRNRLLLVSCTRKAPSLTNKRQKVCLIAQSLCYVPAGAVASRQWVSVSLARYAARMRSQNLEIPIRETCLPKNVSQGVVPSTSWRSLDIQAVSD